jgi:hypothetical protein
MVYFNEHIFTYFFEYIRTHRSYYDILSILDLLEQTLVGAWINMQKIE